MTEQQAHDEILRLVRKDAFGKACMMRNLHDGGVGVLQVVGFMDTRRLYTGATWLDVFDKIPKEGR